MTAKNRAANGTSRRGSSGGFFWRATAMAMAAGLAAGSWAGVSKEGVEYRLAEPLAGDQVRPDLAIGATGGYVAWEDNVGDGDGISVNYRRINATLSGQLEVTQLATRTVGNQERVKVAMLADGGAAFAWQGGEDGAQQVFVRSVSPSGVFFSEEVPVSVRAGVHQFDAAAAGLPNGNVVVTWTVDELDANVKDVYAAVFGPQGQRISGEFKVNQYTLSNQRSSVVAALPDGRFVVGWISENQRFDSSVDLYARVFTAGGLSTGSEFRVNASDKVASSPAVAVTGTGNFTFTWCEIAQDSNDIEVNIIPIRNTDGWDIYASTFNANGRLSAPSRINQTIAGNQRNPSIAAIGTTHLVVWSSAGQDGNGEGIVGRALTGIGTPEGAEFLVNTTTRGNQLHPVARGNGDSRFVVSWASFVNLTANTELMAQRYTAEQSSVVLAPAPAPFVSALSPSRLSVTWPAVEGYQVQNYELYVDGNPTPVVVAGQVHVVSSLLPASTHTFELAYRLLDGQLSPRSSVTTAKTWDEDDNADGLPDDWQIKYWGAAGTWPGGNLDSDNDGVSNRNEYMAGTNPVDAASVLRTQLILTPQGWRLKWNTTAGLMYQVQTTTDFTTWVDYGGQRFAPGDSDSVSVPVGNSLGYYRVNRIR